MAEKVRWKLIGEVGVFVRGARAPLKGKRQHEVLALLLTRVGQNVPLSVICEELWGHDQPKTAKNSVQRFVADIRRAHGEHAGVLQTGPLGYRLEASADAIDVGRVRSLLGYADERLRQRDTDAALAARTDAVDTLSGVAFAGLRRLPFVVVAEAEIDKLRTQAIEELVDQQIELGLFEQALSQLAVHVAAHPFHESATEKLMQVFYRLGRQRDALAAYETIRCNLRDELGLLPGPELQALQHQILSHELGGASVTGDAASRDGASGDATTVAPPAPSPAPSPLPPQLRLPRMVQLRPDVIAKLHVELEQARTGHGKRAVLISAEEGAGKTTTLAQIAGTLHSEGWFVLYGRAAPSTASPYSEWAPVFEHLLEHCPTDYRQACLDPYRRSFETIIGHAPRSDGVGAQVAGASRAGSFADVAAGLTALGRAMPVVVILDDLQWSGASAIDLLDFVTTHAADQVVVMGSFRETGVQHNRPLRRLMSQPSFASRSSLWPLPPLGLDDTKALLEHATEQVPIEIGESDLAAIHHRSGGNAFFATELARSLGQIANPDSSDIEALPRSIRRVVMARLDTLRPGDLDALRAAAVFGNEVDLTVLSLSLGQTMRGLVTVLETLLRAGLLVEEPDTVGSFRFRHDLVRETVLGELSRTLAAMLNESAADALLAHPPTAHNAGPICEHLLAAANPARVEEILDLAERAGEQASLQFAYSEARRWFEVAVEHLDMLETSGSSDRRRRLSLTVALGREMRRLGDADHRRVLLEAGELAYELGAADLLVEVVKSNHLGAHSESFALDPARIDQLQRALDVVPSGSADHALLLALHTVETTFVAPLEERKARSAESIDIARNTDDPAVLCRVLTLRHTAIQAPETLAVRAKETAEALDIAASLTDPHPKWWAHDARVRVLGELGRFTEIEAQLGQMHRLGESLDQPLLTWMHRWHRAAWLLAVDRVDEAEAEAETARSIGASIDEPDTDATYGAIVAGVLLYRGNVRALADLMQALLRQESDEHTAARYRALLAFCLSDLGDGDAWRVLESDIANGFSSFHRDMTWSTSMVACAEALAASAPRHACRALYEMLAPHSGVMAHSGPLFFGSIDRSLGLLAASLDDSGAEQHLAKAAAALESAGASYWLARVRLAMLGQGQARERPDERARWRRQVEQAADLLNNPWLTEQAMVVSAD